MRKKFTALVAVLMVGLLLFTGCKKTEEPEGKPPAENPSANTPATNPPAETPKETMKTGVITEASMHYVQIEAPDGTTYSFAVSDETKTDGQGESLGDTLQVTYSGEYKPMIVADSVAVLEKSQTIAEASKENQDDGHIRYIVGVVEDASMHVISVSWHGTVYNIAKDDNTEVEGSILLGATVEVYHKGNIKEGVLATKIVVKNPPEKPVEVVENTMTGVIMDAANNTVIIRARDGETYTFGKDDNTKVEAELQIGKTVKITYSGQTDKAPMATHIVNSVIAEQN